MTKKDLKSGMKCYNRDGVPSIVCLGTEFGDMFISKSFTDTFDFYEEDLKARTLSGFDIMAIYTCKTRNYLKEDSEWNLIWERKPEIEEISADEDMRRLEQSSGKKIRSILWGFDG